MKGIRLPMVLATLVTAAFLGAATACSTAAKAQTVKVEGTEFSFAAPATVSAGLVTWEFQNKGKQLHHLQLVRLEQGKTFADLQKGLSQPPGSQGGPPTWIAEAGGVGALDPGKAGSITQFLKEGTYALVCYVPDFSDGVSHARKGMVKELKVTGTAKPSALPQAKATVNMKDFSFEMPKLAAGQQAVRLVNQGPQPHEWTLVQLVPGKIPQDFLGWVGAVMEGKPPGPPPAQFIGGTSSLSTGQESLVTLTLPAGSYAAVCFVEDPKSGKPHAALGMVAPFTVE